MNLSRFLLLLAGFILTDSTAIAQSSDPWFYALDEEGLHLPL